MAFSVKAKGKGTSICPGLTLYTELHIFPFRPHSSLAEPTQQGGGNRVEEVKCPVRLKPCLSNYKACASHTQCCLAADCGDLWCVRSTSDACFFLFSAVENFCSLFHFHVFVFRFSIKG